MLKTNLEEELQQWRTARLASPSSSSGLKQSQRTVRFRGSDIIVITRPTRRTAGAGGGASHGS